MKMVKLTEDHYIVVDDTRKEMYTIPTSQAKELLGPTSQTEWEVEIVEGQLKLRS